MDGRQLAQRRKKHALERIAQRVTAPAKHNPTELCRELRDLVQTGQSKCLARNSNTKSTHAALLDEVLYLFFYNSTDKLIVSFLPKEDPLWVAAIKYFVAQGYEFRCAYE